jgi:nucleotide-binding universal stress UspA family protein
VSPDGAHLATIAPIRDIVGGRATLDLSQLDKQPDWSFDDTDSGATPAARLGNTPVHINRRHPTTTWPEWAADTTTDPSLVLAADVHDVHDAIEALIDHAMEQRDEDLDDRVAAVAVAVRTHVDATRRVLFPMARRVGDDEGDRLVDAAEAQEEHLLRLVGEINRSDIRRCMQDIGVAMHEHAAIGDDLVALLQTKLDAPERMSLADGLAAAQATSTVGRLHRTPAHTAPPASAPAPPHGHGWAGEPATRLDPGHLDAPAPPTPRPDPGDLEVEARVDASDLAPAEAVAPTPSGPADRATEPTTDPQPRGVGRTMLVGVDGSPAAGAALTWAARFAARVDAEVVVANVFEPEQAEIAPDAYERLLRDAERRLGEDSTAALAGTGVRHHCLQLTGAPGRLLTAAEDEGADLLVVGTRGSGSHAGLHLGSLAHHLAHHTRSPLAIVPIEGSGASAERIVVAVDGSPGSAAAVRWCADVAVSFGSEVTAVCAFNPQARWGSNGDESDLWFKAAEAISSEWIAPLRSSGAAVLTRLIREKHPRAALEELASSEGAGLLVVGTRALSEVGGLRLDRLPLHLVHHTHLPVIVVPAHDRGEATSRP